MLRGFATVSYFAQDLEAATRWYTELVGVEPYFSVPGPDGKPAYVEFRIGDYQHELGLIDARFAPHRHGEPSGEIIFWHLDDVHAAVERLLAMGARVHEPITPRSDGFVTASVVDPFGNILGVMYNPHYLEILGASSASAG
ncbi:putative enzyme related to lactoylglutathione lyase [Pseudonocardia hierapolitana]|uniref:Putative enzyme related to lactoylglutathione lyase n=1 Tax=Pseudonocardia hierapolitana TaxID=1128676 RepID=A0A561SWF9_9PSEU|nr:VOC family protein [Pseudonocardia hierapolitana]TWF79171.1 putative enzyme related to lactoylglutathione lyase [Pseudonocardia hierapolitana]